MRHLGRMVALCGMVMVGSAVSLAAEHVHEAKPGSAAFERMKQMVGRWEGTSTMMGGKGTEPAAVDYKLTSGGSALVETLFPGTEHEMVSVYHDVGGKLSMTHYCMLGNQPQLDLVSSTDNSLELDLAARSGIDAATEEHMHGLSLTWTDPGHMKQVWTCYKDGKANDHTTITLSRVR